MVVVVVTLLVVVVVPVVVVVVVDIGVGASSPSSKNLFSHEVFIIASPSNFKTASQAQAPFQSPSTLFFCKYLG